MSELPLPHGYAFHHVGFATASIERESGFFEGLGYRVEGVDFEDPRQGVRGRFMTGPGPRIELLESLPGRVTLTPWLQAGVKIYHMGFEVTDLEASLSWIRGQGAKVVVKPVPAVAFGGRCIAFAMLRNRFMIELIEAV